MFMDSYHSSNIEPTFNGNSHMSDGAGIHEDRKNGYHDTTDDIKYERYIRPFDLNEAQLLEIMKIFENEMMQGLSKDGHLRKTPLQMENTYVSDLLNGSESGSYLALDLGGTRFRVHYVQIKDNKITADTVPYPLEQEIIQGPGEELFRYIAKCLVSFLEDKKLKGICHTLSLGFCFSFPIIQKKLNSGLLLTWTKDFRCSGVEGNDVVAMLDKALKEQNLDIKISAILNDSTGTLIAGLLIDPDCCMSVIIGTGCNVAYLEKIENIGTWEGPVSTKRKYSIIDTECGAFGDNGVIDFLKTVFDKEVDQYSKHPGSFSFEKLLSGLYLGELFRVILHHARANNLIFTGQNIPHVYSNFSSKKQEITFKKALGEQRCSIDNRWSLPTKYISAIEDEGDNSNDKIIELLREINLLSCASEEDMRFIKELCTVLISRASKLVASAIAAVLKRMCRPKTGIAIDGSMYKLMPRLNLLIKYWVSRLYPDSQVNIFLSEDGSGKGAALVASIADRLHHEHSLHSHNGDINL